jgi:hypothetical protein
LWDFAYAQRKKSARDLYGFPRAAFRAPQLVDSMRTSPGMNGAFFNDTVPSAVIRISYRFFTTRRSK